MSTTDIRAAHVHKPTVSFRSYHHDGDVLKQDKPWFYTIEIKWSSDPDGSYATSSSIMFTFHEISEVWDFANQLAEVNAKIVDYVMEDHAEFAASRIKQTAEVK